MQYYTAVFNYVFLIMNVYIFDSDIANISSIIVNKKYMSKLTYSCTNRTHP